MHIRRPTSIAAFAGPPPNAAAKQRVKEQRTAARPSINQLAAAFGDVNIQ